MTRTLRIVSILTVILGVFAMAQAQTPLPKTTTTLTMSWLRSLTVSPTSIRAGGKITGTVLLLRPALVQMTVGLTLSGGQAVEGNIWATDGVVMPASMTIAAGSDRGTFTIATSTPTTWSGSKTFTVGAVIGSEKKSTTFTVTK